MREQSLPCKLVNSMLITDHTRGKFAPAHFMQRFGESMFLGSFLVAVPDGAALPFDVMPSPRELLLSNATLSVHRLWMDVDAQIVYRSIEWFLKSGIKSHSHTVSAAVYAPHIPCFGLRLVPLTTT